jgi:two-component system chemotaxis response regulator CheY
MKRTVLVVDDVPFVRKTLVAILAEGHYQVVGEAADGKQAVELYERLRPDVVTMDIVMPGLSGIDATRKILRINKDAKVVVVSAMGQEHLVMEAINVGAKDYIVKPFSAAEVVRTVERALVGEEKSLGRGAPLEQKIG